MKENTNEKSLIKVDDNLFSKIKRFIKALFKIDLKNQATEDNFEVKIMDTNERKKQFEQNLKVEISDGFQKKLEMERIVREIEENPKILNSLSTARLEKISQYYEDMIDELEVEVNNLKKKCNIN